MTVCLHGMTVCLRGMTVWVNPPLSSPNQPNRTDHPSHPNHPTQPPHPLLRSHLPSIPLPHQLHPADSAAPELPTAAGLPKSHRLPLHSATTSPIANLRFQSPPFHSPNRQSHRQPPISIAAIPQPQPPRPHLSPTFHSPPPLHSHQLRRRLISSHQPPTPPTAADPAVDSSYQTLAPIPPTSDSRRQALSLPDSH
ncbi:hypothetical protein LINPERHAP1_LOCUS38263 [Linum perenne]